MADLDEQKRMQEIARADRARELLNNDMLKDAFAAVEREILTAKEIVHAPDEVQKLHMMFVCNRKVQNTLRGYIETGKLAGIQLEQKRKFKLFGVN